MSDGMTCDVGATEPCPRIEVNPEIFVAGTRRCRPKILFVDDEARVVDGIRRALLRYPYTISTTTSPELALQMCHREHFDVVVADERMPGMLGSELLSVLAQESPTSARILLTGHATAEAAARAVNSAGVIRFLLKPCPPDELHEAIEAALKTTPFENRARAGARRMFLVSHRNRVAADAAAVEPPANTHRRPKATATAESSRNELGPRCEPNGDSQASELVLQAQKIATLGELKPFGYEISTRLRTPRGDLHTVGNFIGSVGRYVSVPSVDRWVMQSVLAVLGQHGPVLERRDIRMSLNIAAQSLLDPQFLQFVDREVSRSCVAGRFLIEVRASSLLKNLRSDGRLVWRFLAMDCFKWGCRLCIDAVGEDLAELEPLTELPLAMAKIDSHYIHDILTNRESQSRVASVVEWGKRSGIEIAASGIDTRAIAERLYALGVRHGQGVAFGAPGPLNLLLGAL
jgi:EAL domain-containing protein (putative c-di-GMP-specific phosphodiesterase class I)/DNA-binding NarL/FixJ family response regulator